MSGDMNDPEYEVAEGEDRDSGDEAFLNDAEEEVVAATPEVELLNDVTQHYLNEIGAKPLFTPKEEYHWACLAQNGDFEARQKMIEHNLRLVVNIVKHYLNRGIPFFDLRDLVDSPEHRALDHEPLSDDSSAGSRGQGD